MSYFLRLGSNVNVIIGVIHANEMFGNVVFSKNVT